MRLWPREPRLTMWTTTSTGTILAFWRASEWNLPSEGSSGGGSAVRGGGGGLEWNASTRLVGKPFTITEFNYTAPNPYRAEGGLLVGSAAAIQDWDGLWRFAYAHSREVVIAPVSTDYFNMASDPVGQASERAAVLLFTRGDVRAAPGAFTEVLSRADLTDQPKSIKRAGVGDLTFVTKVGVRVVEKGVSVPGTLPVAPTKGEVRESETGEVRLDKNSQTFRIQTARTVGGVVPAGQSLEAGPLTVHVTDARAAIWVSSLDGQPVSKSRRLLLVHLTDGQNTGMRYTAQDRRILEDWGHLPYLIQRGAAQVTLAHEAAKDLRAWRLDTAGNRVASVPVRVEGKRAVLDLSTRAPDGGATLYYEIGLD